MSAYTRTNWQNTPSTNTPLNAANLNHMEQGIYDAQNAADNAQATADETVAKLDALQARNEASTAAAMTDHDKIYIYTGNETGYNFGHWYYWNGTAWTDGGAYNSAGVNTDTTLSISGAPADAKKTGDELTTLNNALTFEISEISEGTKNINNVICGRYYAKSSGVISSSGSNYFGMSKFVPCDANTDYIISAHNIETISTCYIAEYDSNGDFIQRNTGYSVTTTANTAYLYVDFYNGSGLTIYDDSDIQIEKGTIATQYVKGLSAVDQVARENPSEHSKNIADTLTVSTTGYASIETNGNGYKVTCTNDGKLSYMRFSLFEEVSQNDIGKVFTLSAELISKSGTDTRINFLSNNTNRKSNIATTVGKYYLSYEITDSDVGRALYAGLYASVTSPLNGQYSIWHDIQIIETSLVLPFIGNKTCVDSTTRIDLMELNAISEKGVTLTDNTVYYIKTRKSFPIILSLRAKYTGTQPTVVFSNKLYTSPSYNIGDTEYVMQSFRIPPDLSHDKTTIAITIPSGSSLNIDFFETKDVSYNPSNHEVKPDFCSHLGFIQMCPENTRPSVEMAGILGYTSCIVVPKVTADGVLVCIHDDTINSRAMDADGNAPSTEMAVSDMTYAQLLEWDFGRYKNAYWTGTKILTVDEFFSICARYGMKPMFSTHPALTSSQWQEVKSMLIKHGLLSKFHVKAFSISILNTAYNVFGQDIDGYTGEHGDNYVTIAQLQSFVSTNNIDTKKCHVISEKSINTIDSTYVASVLTAGLECGCYTITSSHNASTIKQLISYGVTSFTDDTYCQNGMNW